MKRKKGKKEEVRFECVTRDSCFFRGREREKNRSRWKSLIIMYNLCISARTIQIYIETRWKKERKKERGKEKRSVLDRGKFSSLIFCLKREKTTHDPRLWMPKIHGNKCNIVTWNKREDYMCVWEKIRFTFRFLRSFCSLCFFLSHWRLQRERKACVIYFFSCIISFYFL